MKQPDIFDYTDHRRYLADWFAWRKAHNSRYSHRAFARRVGTTDPSLLVNVIKGRRKIPARLIDDVIGALGLEDDDASYFTALVRLGQARDERERERAWAELASLRSALRKPEIDPKRLRYFSDRRFSALRSLAECDGCRAEPSWIAAHMRPAMTAQEAADALALLEELDFVRREGDTLRVTEAVVRTDSRVENFGSLEYHAQNLALAQEVLEEVRLDGPVQEESAYIGVTVAVPSERLPELRTLLYEHMHQILHTCNSWTDRDRVVQVNVQMFPASAPTTA